jgi:very-short-patch-repair endonuclease
MGAKITQDEYIARAKEKHGNRFDYRLVEYRTMQDKIKIICTNHGQFEQKAQGHLMQKYGCLKCAQENVCAENGRKTTQKTTEQFIKEVKGVHGDKYCYSTTKYKTCNDFVEIICKKHGMFKQRAHNHRAGMGCQQCYSDYIRVIGSIYTTNGLSLVGKNEYFHFTPEVDEFCSKYNIKVEKQYPVFTGWYRSYYVDFVFPEINLAIEYDEKRHERKDIKEKDANRQMFIEKKEKLEFIRFKDEEFMKDKTIFCETMKKWLTNKQIAL